MRRRGGTPVRAGVSAVEVLLATAVIAVALVAVMGLSQSQQRAAFFAEYHVQAQWRAASLIAALSVRDLTELEKELAPGGLDAAGGEVAVPAKLLPPPGRVLVEWMPAARAAPGRVLAALDAAPSRSTLFRDEAFLSREPPGGPAGTLVWRLRARVLWTFPGDAQPHSYELERLIARPGLSHHLRVAWPVPGAVR